MFERPEPERLRFLRLVSNENFLKLCSFLVQKELFVRFKDVNEGGSRDTSGKSLGLEIDANSVKNGKLRNFANLSILNVVLLTENEVSSNNEPT